MEKWRMSDTASMTKTALDEAAVSNGCWFDIEAAERVRAFFAKFLRHSKGKFAGLPFELLPWQWESIVKPLYGWKRADGTRRYRRVGIWVPKKNGKTTLCSGLMLYGLMGDNEVGAEIYGLAADQRQASLTFQEACQMVRQSEMLSKYLRINETKKRIFEAGGKGGFIEALSSESGTKEGFNAHYVIFDELHAQPDRRLWDTMYYASAMREQPLSISISTAGFDRNTIGYEQYKIARDISDGVGVAWDFLAAVYEVREDDDWTAPATWERANPSWGVTIKPDEFQGAYAEAANYASKQNTFRRYRLNQWTQQDERWIPMDHWDQCDLLATDAELAAAQHFLAIDVSSVRDITALADVARLSDGRVSVSCYFWVPEENASLRERDDHVPYVTWNRMGLVEFCHGASINQDDVKRKAVELLQKYDVRGVAFDPWQGEKLAAEIEREGTTAIKFPQSMASFAAPSKELEKLIFDHRLIHWNNPVLRWMAGNVAPRRDGPENVMPSKKNSSEKIDGIVALVMALGISTEQTSIYDTPGGMIL